MSPCPGPRPRSGQGPAPPQLASPTAGEGLTPSSCSPDAGSGIHICVIINLGVSSGDGGGGGRFVPPSLLPPSSKRAAAKQGGWEGERGSSPGAAGSLPTASRGDELGGRQECLPIFHTAYPPMCKQRAGMSQGPVDPRAGGKSEWVSLKGAGP